MESDGIAVEINSQACLVATRSARRVQRFLELPAAQGRLVKSRSIVSHIWSAIIQVLLIVPWQTAT
jgi:hypothetical protein